MINATQIRNGMIILHSNEPYRIINFKFTVHGRGGNTISSKMRNLFTGAHVEYRFRSDDKVDDIEIDQHELEYLYQGGNEYWFMDTSSFEQFALSHEDVADVIGYILPNTTCKGEFYKGRCIGISVAANMQLTIVETAPVLKGASAAGNVTKEATLDSGLTLQVPLFVDTGDIIIVNTTSGEYQGRPGKI